jgi:hypothetical protein
MGETASQSFQLPFNAALKAECRGSRRGTNGLSGGAEEGPDRNRRAGLDEGKECRHHGPLGSIRD